MIKTALIGYTGFVGSNLAKQYKFTDLYNSKNIHDIAGKTYDLIVCAGVPAVKWLANKNPEDDLKNILSLFENLSKVECKRMILISTVDVFNTPIGVSEYTNIDTSILQPYGKHRKMFEDMISEKFDTLVIRLPGLVGEGLKKNVVYDMIHNNNIDAIDPNAIHQYYNVSNLWRDISFISKHAIGIAHIVTEPILVHDIAKQFFPRVKLTEKNVEHSAYNVRSVHGYVNKSVEEIRKYLHDIGHI